MTTLRRLLVASTLIVTWTVASSGAIDPGVEVRAINPVETASVGGKYRVLLRQFKAPNDRAQYGYFRDFGPWSGTSYAGQTDLPPGIWVYVYPSWYIWRERAEE